MMMEGGRREKSGNDKKILHTSLTPKVITAFFRTVYQKGLFVLGHFIPTVLMHGFNYLL